MSKVLNSPKRDRSISKQIRLYPGPVVPSVFSVRKSCQRDQYHDELIPAGKARNRRTHFQNSLLSSVNTHSKKGQLQEVYLDSERWDEQTSCRDPKRRLSGGAIQGLLLGEDSAPAFGCDRWSNWYTSRPNSPHALNPCLQIDPRQGPNTGSLGLLLATASKAEESLARLLGDWRWHLHWIFLKKMQDQNYWSMKEQSRFVYAARSSFLSHAFWRRKISREQCDAVNCASIFNLKKTFISNNVQNFQVSTSVYLISDSFNNSLQHFHFW